MTVLTQHTELSCNCCVSRSLRLTRTWQKYEDEQRNDVHPLKRRKNLNEFKVCNPVCLFISWPNLSHIFSDEWSVVFLVASLSRFSFSLNFLDVRSCVRSGKRENHINDYHFFNKKKFMIWAKKYLHGSDIHMFHNYSCVEKSQFVIGWS